MNEQTAVAARCSGCGQPIPENPINCPNCGRRLSASSRRLQPCADCGKDVSKKAVACPHCGRRIAFGIVISSAIFWTLLALLLLVGFAVALMQAINAAGR